MLSHEPGKRTSKRWWRILRRVLVGLALLPIVVIVLALVALELRPVRQLVVNQVNGVLQSTFAGRIHIENVDGIGLTGVRGVRARVFDPGGVPVLLVDGVEVRVGLISTLRSFFVGKGDKVIDLADLRVDYVDANLDGDDAGNLRIANAFQPRDTTPSAPAERKTAIHLGHFALTHAWVHGLPSADAPLVDADIDRLKASAEVGSSQNVVVENLEILTRAMPSNANARLVITASYAAPAKSGQDKAARVDVHGAVGEIPLTARASLDGPAVDAVIDVPKASPEMIAKLAPGASLTQDLSLHAAASGRLPDLEATVHAAIGAGSVDVRAHAVLADEKVIHATLAARDIDAHAFAASAPASDVAADATVDVTSREGNIDGKWTFDVGGSMAGSALPRAHLGGAVRGTSGTEGSTVSVHGSGEVVDPGLHATLEFDVRQGDGRLRAEFETTIASPDVARTRLGSSVKGSLELRARGSFVSDRVPSFDVDADLRASNVVQQDQRLDRAWLRAHVRGPTDDPSIDAIFQGSGITAGGMRFARAALTAHGSLRRQEVTLGADPIDAPRIDARATIEMENGTHVRDANVAFARDDVRAVVGVKSLHLSGDAIEVDGISIEGLGDPVRAELKRRNGRLSVRTSTNELDLARVARLLRLNDVQEGHLAWDIDLDARPNDARGHVRLDLHQGTFGRVKNGEAHIEATLEGRTIDAVVHAKLGQIGHLDMDPCHIEFGGRGALDDPSSWKAARGKLSLDSEIDLAQIRRLLPRGSVDLTDLAGRLRLTGEVARESLATPVPDVRLALKTRGLLVSGRGERENVGGVRVYGGRPWSLEGVDVELTTSVAHETGATTVTSKVTDRSGVLASLDAEAPSVPYQEWLAKKTLPLDRILAMRLKGRLAVPRRAWKTFPAMLKTQQFAGDVGGEVTLDGSLADPDVHFAIETNKFSSTIATTPGAFDAKVDGRYLDGEAKVSLAVASSGKTVLDGNVDMQARVESLLRATNEEGLAWRASTKVRLTEFPLTTLQLFSDLRMRGFASGELTVDDLHEDARAKVELALRDLRIGRARFPRGTARADFDGQLARASIRLDQTDGFVAADAQAGMTWGSETAPTPTTDVPAFATLRANRFRAAALRPFVSSVVSELDGRITADARIDVKQGGGPPSMKGTIALDEGLVQLTHLGEPLHGVHFKVAVTPDGLVRIEDFTAHGSTGTVNMKAVARLNGFDLVGAGVNLRIPRRDALPVDIDGQDIGDVDGDVSVKVTRTPDGRVTNVAVDIPRLHVLLPLSSTNKVQELGEADRVRVGYFRRSRQFILLPKDADDLEESVGTADEKPPAQTNVSVHFGNDVEIKRGTTLRVQLEGDPKIEITDKARMSGQIRLTHGILEVQGKRFEIEKGIVTFVGDEPGNPQVMVTAGWTAPDGTRVYADFEGPVKTGKVRLRSEPARPQNEVLALIMFGTAEGSSSTPYASRQPDGATRAGATAGGFATEGLSKGLDELTGLEVQTRIDTTNSANPKPEIEVQVARDISLQLGYVLGTPPPGTNPDKTLITVDWRFKRNWSMEATFGDRGSSILDFVWRYRY